MIAEWVISGWWGVMYSQEGNKNFLATCECTKHPKITTVAVQGLDTTCADYSECHINKGDLLDLLQGLKTNNPRIWGKQF